MKIKLVVLFLAAYFVGIQGAQRHSRDEEFMVNLEECKKKVNATDGDIEILKSRHRLSTKASQCLMACIKKKIGIMAADNTINLTLSKESLENLKKENKRLYDQMVKTLETCKEKETLEMDECVAAKKYSDCIIDIREKEKFYET